MDTTAATGPARRDPPLGARRRGSRRWPVVVVVLLVTWLLLVVLATLLQRQLIYLPDASPPLAPPDVVTVGLTTDDGLELDAWLLESDQPHSTVLVLPGNAGNRSDRLPMARGLRDRGHTVLLVDYRGFGGNPGSPSEDGLLADARAAREHLRARFQSVPMAYLGESIGTGVAAALAVEQPPAALVLRSPFPELADVVRSIAPVLPVRTVLWDRFPIAEQLAGYREPVLVVAGDRDGIVPSELSREVADQLQAPFVEIAGAGHNDPELSSGARFLGVVDEFLRSTGSDRER